MVIGEIVEILIRVHDSGRISREEDDALCAACNILDKLPRLMDEYDVQEILCDIHFNR